MADLRQDIINYGKPKPNEIVALSEKILKATVFIEESTALTSQRFFTGKETQDGFWNNFKFPLTETCLDIRGIRITHNLSLLGNPVEMALKAQQMFEETSWLRVKYRRRSERLNYNLALLTPSVILANGTVAAQYTKSGSVHNNGFYLLPNALQVGAQQDIEFLLDVQSGFTTSANDALGTDATPTPPNSTLTAAGFYISVELLVTEQGESAI